MAFLFIIDAVVAKPENEESIEDFGLWERL